MCGLKDRMHEQGHGNGTPLDYDLSDGALRITISVESYAQPSKGMGYSAGWWTDPSTAALRRCEVSPQSFGAENCRSEPITTTTGGGGPAKKAAGWTRGIW